MTLDYLHPKVEHLTLKLATTGLDIIWRSPLLLSLFTEQPTKLAMIFLTL